MNQAQSVEEYFKSISFVPMFWLPIKEFSKRFGVTEKAIEGKIRDRKWKIGEQYVKDPDGRIHVSVIGYQKWVESRWQQDKESEEQSLVIEASSDCNSTGYTQKTAQKKTIAGQSRHKKRILKAID